MIRQVARLDLRAKFIVEGFLAGLHASPFQGFSVEFSEHRKYVPGDDLKDLDWNVYAKTDKYYLKKFQAETNVTGYLVMDLSASMAYTYRQELTKFEYAICLAAALGYLMIHQQDPVGLVDVRHRASAPACRRAASGPHLGTILSVLANLKPTRRRPTWPRACTSWRRMMRGKSLVMIFSDLLTDPGPVMESLHHLRHRGHEIILFHILDEAEVSFPVRGAGRVRGRGNAGQADAGRQGHAAATTCRPSPSSARRYRAESHRPASTTSPWTRSVSFDKALMEYLVQRQRRC